MDEEGGRGSLRWTKASGWDHENVEPRLLFYGEIGKPKVQNRHF